MYCGLKRYCCSNYLVNKRKPSDWVPIDCCSRTVIITDLIYLARKIRPFTGIRSENFSRVGIQWHSALLHESMFRVWRCCHRCCYRCSVRS
ncbi:unnamed protein product [Periconia digitata]|uniref:Uncharacterized protein n=1 Tax=Periconia digitata TaxID=1303443 RepID=A0A9W4XV16_9PLEO|nr:unnamed protein product [Periconia digitata]